MAKIVDGYYEGDQESLFCQRVRECTKCKETKNIMIDFPTQGLICKLCARIAVNLKRNGVCVKNSKKKDIKW
jgi:hypothetical protein